MKCCDLKSGDLRHLIDIQRAAKVRDASGGYATSWSSQSQPHAKIKPISGNERWQAMKTEANITHKMYIRYESGLLPSDRIVFDSRTFQIKAIINLEERNKWLEISAIEGEVT